MRKLLLSLAACVWVWTAALAQADVLKDGVPERYTVVKGDTLWDIANRFLNSPWLWPEIWHVNEQIENPHLIFPGDVLGFVLVDGERKLTTLSRGDTGRTVKLTPTARIEPLASAIPTISLSAIGSFLNDSRIVSQEELEESAYVLSGLEDSLVTGAGDTIYGRGDLAGQDTVGIYRPGVLYIDPDTEEELGFEAEFVGQARVEAVGENVSTLSVTRSAEEVDVGDRLLPLEDRQLESFFEPSAPEQDINGYMLSVLGGVTQIGQFDVVVINKGQREGLTPGNVLAIYKKGGLVADPFTREKVELPSERAGILMVYRAFEKLSYGVVLKATRPLSVLDEVRNP